jgi:hypothetical protein
MCEVFPDRPCVWVHAYERYATVKQMDQFVKECVPPKLQELRGTSSWLNFHLKRDYHVVLCQLSKNYSTMGCQEEGEKKLSHEKLFGTQYK